jgi:anti-anti-sigma factor
VLNVDLSIRDFDGQAVVALRGELNLADAPRLGSRLIAAVAACGPSVIVDLAGLEGIGYIGLSVLLRVRRWTRQSGGDLFLAAPQQPVHRILEATGLIDVFAVYPSVKEAPGRVREARPWSPAPQRRRAAMVGRSGGRRPACCTARRSLVRPLPRRRMCRPGSIAGKACVTVSGARREGPPRPDRSWLIRWFWRQADIVVAVIVA